MSSKSKAKPKAKQRPGRPAKPSAPPTAQRVGSLRDLAGILGCSYEALRKARENGEITASGDGTFSVEQARAAMAERAERGKSGSSALGADGPPGTSEAKHWDKEWRKAKAIGEQIKVKERLGELVEKADVVRAQVERELAFKHVVMALPRKLSPLLVGKGRVEIEATLTTACTDALRHLATGQ